MAVFHCQLHGAGLREDFFHLSQVDQESAVAPDNHRVGVQVVLHLLGRSAKHICADLTIGEVANFHIITDRLNIQKVSNL